MNEELNPVPPQKADSYLKRAAGTLVIRRELSTREYVVYGAILAIIGILAFYSWRVFFLRDFAAQSKTQIYTQLDEARKALRNLDPAGARNPLQSINDEITLVGIETQKYGVLSLSRLWGLVSDKVRAIPSALQNLAGLSGTAIHLNEDISFLKENAARLMLEKQGAELAGRLAGFHEKLRRLTEYIDQIDRNPQGFGENELRALANLRAEINRNSEALDAVTGILMKQTPVHMLVLFQNPTELRPGGGFIGSYANLTLQEGSILDIEVRDIYDPDGQLDQRVIPPEPLQVITKDWEARDANWFLDYPTSAKKVIQFLNNSKIYSERGVRFDGAIAVNTNVLKDIVTLIGPLELPEYKLTVTPENFLREIQREVEAGADKKVNQPKRILQVLTPRILAELSTLNDTEKKQFAMVLQRHLIQRNIMVYVNDKTLERYLISQGIGGDVLQVNPAVVSEYVAVANANIGGAKSDAFMSQTIDFKSVIDEFGGISNTLTINRKHSGAKQKEWWYRSTNRNYLQVYTSLGSRLTAAGGRSLWPKTPVLNYRDYSTDPTVANIDATRRYLDDFGIDRYIAHDKTVFGAWVSTAAGTSTKYFIEYKNPRIFMANSGTPYEFIFEKQSGASTTLSISISAPPRYKWKEINRGVIEYETADPVGRIRIRQTLVPIAE